MIGKIYNRQKADVPRVEKIPENKKEEAADPVTKIELPDVISSDIGFQMMFGFGPPHNSSQTVFRPQSLRQVPMRNGIKNSTN